MMRVSLCTSMALLMALGIAGSQSARGETVILLEDFEAYSNDAQLAAA